MTAWLTRSRVCLSLPVEGCRLSEEFPGARSGPGGGRTETPSQTQQPGRDVRRTRCWSERRLPRAARLPGLSPARCPSTLLPWALAPRAPAPARGGFRGSVPSGAPLCRLSGHSHAARQLGEPGPCLMAVPGPHLPQAASSSASTGRGRTVRGSRRRGRRDRSASPARRRTRATWTKTRPSSGR